MTPERPAPANAAASPAGSISPIADLSYRNYDGPLYTRAARWWIVAVANIRLVRKKPGFWILALIALLPYLIVGVLLYFQSGALSNVPNPLVNNTPGQKYASQFFRAYQQQAFWLFLIALMVGASSIAADNKANALLVYLSKPISKGDYLLGKWMGIFLILFGVAVIPALVLYFYCLTSYISEGFLKEEPLLILRVLLACAVPAAIHSSLIVGFSAWSKTPRMAGAIYAAFYFVVGFITSIVWGILYHRAIRSGDLDQGVLLRHLSVDGVIQGLGQNIYAVDERVGFMQMVMSRPPVMAMVGLAAILVVLGVGAARAKVRAVEVVRG